MAPAEILCRGPVFLANLWLYLSFSALDVLGKCCRLSIMSPRLHQKTTVVSKACFCCNCQLVNDPTLVATAVLQQFIKLRLVFHAIMGLVAIEYVVYSDTKSCSYSDVSIQTSASHTGFNTADVRFCEIYRFCQF